MPATRSSRLPKAEAEVNEHESEPQTPKKRKAKSASPTKASAKKPRVAAATKPTPALTAVGDSAAANGDADPALPATLSFDFDAAKAHLIEQDSRWEDIFKKMKCKPFENLDHVHPFRALTTSILGQQISWMAARSIKHRFIRLFDSSLPENVADYEAHSSASAFFPTPHQVFDSDIATLRTAGLSQRKAEYVHDLAARFTDGRLSAQKLLEASDEELADMLLEVRGIGQWTVDMFAIFSMRRPNILPVGDLGVQRGALRWFLSLHLPTYHIKLSAEKAPGDDEKKAEGKDLDAAPEPKTPPPSAIPLTDVNGHDEKVVSLGDVAVILPPGTPTTPGRLTTTGPGENIVPDASGHHDNIPEPFTPSINRTLQSKSKKKLNPLPAGLTTSIMKSRLDTKKKIKGALLSEQEMVALTEPWEPYRSIAAYYMWALADEK